MRDYTFHWLLSCAILSAALSSWMHSKTSGIASISTCIIILILIPKKIKQIKQVRKRNIEEF